LKGGACIRLFGSSARKSPSVLPGPVIQSPHAALPVVVVTATKSNHADLQTPARLQTAAGFSPCGCYRYWLTRTWDESRSAVCWLMLNPSTADATRDDPTIRRCIGIARRWGHGGIVAVNLFALRATDPAELVRAVDPVGPENDAAVRSHTAGLRVIAAWGSKGRPPGPGRSRPAAPGRLPPGVPRHYLDRPASASVVCRRRRVAGPLSADGPVFS